MLKQQGWLSSQMGKLRGEDIQGNSEISTLEPDTWLNGKYKRCIGERK